MPSLQVQVSEWLELARFYSTHVIKKYSKVKYIYIFLPCNFDTVLTFILVHYLNVQVNNNYFCGVRQNGGRTEWLSILNITQVRTGSLILEKVWKFANQFSRHGKSLGKW